MPRRRRAGVHPAGELVKAVSLPTDAPIIAAGEVRMGDQVADLLERGATAVQLGAAFPRSPESGAKPAHKDALVSGQLTHIVGTLVLWASCEMTAQQLRWRT